MRLVGAINAVPAISSFANVDVVGKPNRLSNLGSSYAAATLRAAAILLRMHSGWNWFVALSASDYPLLTQDGMLIWDFYISDFPVVFTFNSFDMGKLIISNS